jgi:hypothetical protein
MTAPIGTPCRPIQQRNIPEVIRSLSGMDSPDYIDLFTVTTNGAADASPEQWSRTAIEDVVRRSIHLARPRSAAGVAAFVGAVAIRSPIAAGWIRLEASSWFLTAHLVTRLDDGHLSVGTFIRYDRPIAALIWVPASAVHRRAMPGLLLQTVRLITSSSNQP